MCAVFERAIKHCPWSADLWSAYIRALERLKKAHQEIESVFHRARSSTFVSADELAKVLLTWCEYMRRRIVDASETDQALVSDLRSAFNTGYQYLYHCRCALGLLVRDAYARLDFPDGDAGCVLEVYEARLEAVLFKTLDRTRDIFEQLLRRHGRRGDLWLEYVTLERFVSRCLIRRRRPRLLMTVLSYYGSTEKTRSLFKRAVNFAPEWAVPIVTAWTQFERELGTTETVEIAYAKMKTLLDTAAVTSIVQTTASSEAGHENGSRGKNSDERQTKPQKKRKDVENPAKEPQGKKARTESAEPNIVTAQSVSWYIVRTPWRCLLFISAQDMGA